MQFPGTGCNWRQGVENPFRYGEIVTGSYFTDRSEEIREILADMRNGQNVVLTSPRRYGKTSLLFEVLAQARKEGALAAYVDLFRTPSKERFADHLADAIFGGLVAPLDRVFQRAVGVFQKLPLQPKVTINTDGTPTFEFSAGSHERDIDRTIERLLLLPGEIATQRHRRVVLVLDEFQEVVALDPNLPSLMRAVFQLQADVAHVFAGSRRHVMQQVFTDQNQPMYRLAKPMTLRGIASHDFKTFIEERFAATGQRIGADAIEHILEITEGQPHDTQELCYFLWDRALETGVEADPSMVDAALDRVLDAEESRYTVLWEGLTPYRRLVVTALANDVGGEIFSEGYRRRNGLGPASSLQRAIRSLSDREIVEFAVDGSYRVPDVFLRSWVRRRLGPSPVNRVSDAEGMG